MKIRIAAISGALAVVAGASGAHGKWADHIESLNRMDQWDTAVFYHLIHSVVLLGIGLSELGGSARSSSLQWSFRLLLLGMVLFSGSLYLLAGSDLGVLGAITPVGGLALISGWLTLAFSHRVQKEPLS